MKPTRPPSHPCVRDKFVAARAELSAALIERDDEVDLALTALVAREHVLLVGPLGRLKASSSTASPGGSTAAGSAAC